MSPGAPRWTRPRRRGPRPLPAASRSRMRSAVAQSRLARARARSSRSVSTNGSWRARASRGPSAARSPRRAMSARNVALALSRSGLSSPPRTRAAIAVSRSSSAPTAAGVSSRDRAPRRTCPRAGPSRPASAARPCAVRPVLPCARFRRAPASGLDLADFAGRQLRAASPSASIGRSVPLGTARSGRRPGPSRRPAPRDRGGPALEVEDERGVAVDAEDERRRRAASPRGPAAGARPCSRSGCRGCRPRRCRSGGRRPRAGRSRRRGGRAPRASADPRRPCRSRTPGSMTTPERQRGRARHRQDAAALRASRRAPPGSGPRSTAGARSSGCPARP